MARRVAGDTKLGRDLSRSGLTILDCIDHPKIWAPWFDRNRKSWRPWRVYLSTLFNLPITDPADIELVLKCTGRSKLPTTGFTESWLIVGRRGGKSFTLALIACYLAVFKDWSRYLSPGDTATIKVIAVDRSQARVIHKHCRTLLTEVQALAPLVIHDDRDTIELANGVVIEIASASFRTVRGYTLVAALLDEQAFWYSDESKANPDTEIIAALRPAMLNIPGAMLLAASSPYSKRGELWNAYRRHWGKDDAPALIWNADTQTMRPSISKADIAKAYASDPASAAAEYGGQFRSDLEAYLSREIVESVVVDGRYELPYVPGTNYTAFVDPSGGSGDSMTLAIAHRDKDGRGTLDLVREVIPPFSPETAAAEFSATCFDYQIKRVVGDRYAGEWPREQFRKRGITYEPSERSKSDLYKDFLPLINSGKVELLDHTRLTSQLCSLERRTTRGTGKDIIDHPLGPSFHDDVANAAAGALTLVAGRPGPMKFSDAFIARSKIPMGRSIGNHRIPTFW